MTKSVVSLEDKYLLGEGRVFMSAIQALVRIPLDQARRDRAAGRRRAGFISGYRGSPLGNYDSALWAAKPLLDAHEITFLPGLNEELAASGVRGTQELLWLGKSQYEGVFALWYGKGVGTDRGMEALKLGNLEGSSPDGGVLVVTGDDHGGKSSASAHQSEHTLIAAMIPILYPSNPREILEYGQFGWEMSRYSGLYVGLKCVTDTLDFSASVGLPDPQRVFVRPAGFKAPPEGLGLRQMRSPLAQEDWAVNRRLPAAQAFARANGIDRVVLDSPVRNLSIVTAGKAYLDVRQALNDLGLDAEACARHGVRLLKLGMVWPIDSEVFTAFAERSKELLVVEEKRPVIEQQAAAVLFSLDGDARPRLSGKRDDEGRELLPSVGELSPASVQKALFRRLDALGMADDDMRARFARNQELVERARRIGGGARIRPAYYCAGCPNNNGTRLPDGSIAISAVGCHGLAAFMPERRTLMPMPMGGDGMPWISAGPFVDTPHIFQNMGDGTYAHSGILAVRQAVAAGSTMTFKILYNDAVAMTGGQPVEGAPTPLDIVRQLLAERVESVVIVTDEPENFTGANRPPAGVEVFHRDDLDRVQRTLRERTGVSGLVYVQTCAAEKRRRRKRGTYPDPDLRVFINPAVCEGCGDCSAQSNCVSIQPLETEFGRKRRIDQSSCNKDYSCINGFCPSFVTVEGAAIARHPPIDAIEFEAELAVLPAPSVAGEGTVYNLVVTGIGGTGVLTIGAVLGMAAHLEGKGCSVLDQTGMAQKGGAVTSHLRIGPDQDAIFTARLDVGMADLIIGCDMIVTSHADVLKTVKPGCTQAVLNSDVTPTGEFQTNGDLDFAEPGLRDVIDEAMAGGKTFALHATQLALDLTGDSISTNFLIVGFALQHGLLPVSLEALREAILLNGANATENLRALGLGRLAAAKPELLEARSEARLLQDKLSTLEGVLNSRVPMLTDYQDAQYAKRYLAFIEEIESCVRDRPIDDGRPFVREVALTLARLMSYKDEYEVARLFADPRFKADLEAQFEGNFRMSFHLAPPVFNPRRDAAGRPRKIRFGQSTMVLFRLLRRMKGLRGTPLDPFGYFAERRQERALVDEYRELVRDAAERLTNDNFQAGIDLAHAAAEVRGFGPVKAASLQSYRQRLPTILAAFEMPATAAPVLAPVLHG